MPFRFTEQHATALAQASLHSGERLLFRARGVEKPWYSYILARAGAFLWRNYLVVGTSHRLLLIQHKGLMGGYAPKKVDALPYHEITRMKLGWGIFTKGLSVLAPNRRISKTIVLGRFWLPKNFDGAADMVRAWQERALPPAPQHAALPHGGAGRSFDT